MVIDTLTQLNDLITNGTGPERIAFKNIIVNGLNAQDIADIITSSTRVQKEALAVLVRQADSFKLDTDKTAADAQRVIDVGIAQTWYDVNIVPTLTWNNGQALSLQFTNSLDDRRTLELLTEKDAFRKKIISDNINAITARIKTIKVGL